MSAAPSVGAARRLPRWRARLRRHAPAVLAAACGLAWIGYHAGARVFSPTRIEWVMPGDFGAAFVGWLFFRSAPWGFPLGNNPAFPYPIGSTLAYSDGIPLLGAIAKAFDPLLPQDFHYIGLWIVSAFALQGFVGAKLVRTMTPAAAPQVFGGAFLAMSPALTYRAFGHATLTAHWLVLAALWANLAPLADARAAARRTRIVLVLVILAAGAHPYLLAMVLALALAFVLRCWTVDRALDARGAARVGATLLVAAVVALWTFGFLGTRAATGARGYGYFSADLLTLVNSMGASRILPWVSVGPGQLEGFGYLGAGGLLLAGAALVLIVVRRGGGAPAGRRFAFATLVAVLLAAFAVSGETITLAGRPVASASVQPLLPMLTESFRGNGRFIWPLHYLVLAGALLAVVRRTRTRPVLGTALLAAAVIIQVADVRNPGTLPVGSPPRAAEWELARGRYDHVAIHPPCLADGGHGNWCGTSESCGDLAPAAIIAGRLGATLNSGYLARLPVEAAKAACGDAERVVETRRLDPRTLYLVRGDALAALAAPGSGATCGRLDGLEVCVADAGGGPLHEALRRARHATAGGDLPFR